MESLQFASYIFMALLTLLAATEAVRADTIEKMFPPPPGFTRTLADSSSYTEYLRKLNVLPDSTPVRRYDSTIVNAWPSTVRVLDLPFLFNADLEQCADIGYRLYADYAHSSGADSLISFRLQNGQELSWNSWKQGKRLRFRSELDSHFTVAKPPDSSTRAFHRFLHYLFQWSGSAAMKDYLMAVSEENLAPGDLIVQNTTGGIGHVSIILDKCTNDSGDARYLIANGWTPAQTPFIWRAGDQNGTGYWFSIEGYRRHLATFDFGAFSFRSFRRR